MQSKILHCVQEKGDQDVFVIPLITRGQLWWHLVYSFLNKSAAKSCKHFPPHLNDVSTLPCETWNAYRSRATIELLDRETPEFIQPQLWPANSPDLNPVDNIVWEILQEKVYKTRNTDLQLSTTPTDEWLPQWRHDPAWPSPFSVAVTFHPDRWCVFCRPTHSPAVFPNTVINSTQIWRIWRPQLRWDKFWSFFLWHYTGITCVMNIASATR